MLCLHFKVMISKAFSVSFYYLIFLCCCSLNQLLQTNAVSRNETDLLSLLAIKDQIQGLSSWNQSSHFCRWQGVTCGKHHQRVIALNLSSQSLAGSISPHIGNLSYLRSINLEKNKLHGVIPQEMGRLPLLQYINLRSNALTGEIPENITQCTDLETIFFAHNNLTGTIPAKIGFLPKLQFLYLGVNTLTGRIPVSFGNLSSLKVFDLGDNHLEGSIPHTLGKLSSLRVFVVELNSFSSEVPPSIFNISSITNFSLVANQLTGSLPPDMGIKLPNLLFFAASGNQLSGHFPVSLGNASNIRLFDITTNALTGQVPNNFGALQYIKWLAFSDNELGRGEDGDLNFMNSLVNLSSLETVSVSYNNFGGVLPLSMSNFSVKLTTLYLGHNPIVGIMPEGIGNLVNLFALGLEATRIHGNIPSSIGNIKRLQALSLYGSELTGPIPSSLANNTNLFVLDLSANRLEGSIPSGLGDFRYLQQLDLSQNNLNGTIPEQIFGISSLSNLLNFSQNSLTGTLPASVGNLKNLRVMDVSRNKLSGEVPNALGDCSSMEALYLENNLFRGVIPHSLTSLRGIRYINLSNNSLFGQIPKDLEELPYLEGLNLSFNELEGEVPKKGIFGNVSVISVTGNIKLCGGIYELHLLTCRVDNSRRKRSYIALKLSISIFVALAVLVAITFLICYLKKKPREKISSSKSLKARYLRVSYGQLFKATGGFSPDNFLGSGSFGRVYRGKLDQDEMIVAVKVFDLQQRGASKSFKAECESLRHIRHRNLVKIVTSCSSTDFEGNDFKAIVFEYMPNGSLEEWLHPTDNGQVDLSKKLNLYQRLNIAADVASALSYLHHQSHISIVHRDLKPSNVLLDNSMVAHVGDFGLARLLAESRDNLYENQSTSLAIKGSIGYVAPEYGMGGGASTEGDMYSFGILLLEMLTGRRPTDEMFVDGLDIHNFARRALPDRIMEIVDPILTSTDEAVRECIALVVSIGLACSSQYPGERMNMEEVAKKLDSIRDVYSYFSEE